MSIRLEKSAVRSVKIGNTSVSLVVARDMDELIDDYVQAQVEGLVPAHQSPFGAVLWPSGQAFVRYWHQEGMPIPDEVFELGTGVGFVSGYFAAQGSKKVIATDYEPSLAAFVEENAKRICAAFGTENNAENVKFTTLDWAQPCPVNLTGTCRFLVATDVLYENEHIEHLPRIARELLHPEGVFYLADPERYRWTSAKERIEKLFSRVRQVTLKIETDRSDASSGVVTLGTTFTQIHILECQP
jgi:predicted nicotinamide N-methyase